jgi:mono/diheme cytochrome c family protein
MIRSNPTCSPAVIALAALATVAAIGCKSHALPNASAANPATPRFYPDYVRPVFQRNCYKCHSGLNHRGGLQLDTREHLMRGGKDGAVIVPGHPEQSLMVKLIRHEGPAGDPMPMPPKSKLSDADIATITRWIQAGALMPEDEAH